MTSLALLIARIGLGIVFVAHGWQKFDEMGVPAPELAAYFATFAELVGGAALLIGAFTAVAGVLLVLDMLGALLFMHIDKGVFVTEGGFELVVALGVGALLVAVFGAGRYSVDGLLGRKIGRAGALARS